MSRKRLKGTIKKLSSAKTVAVEVVRVYHHPRYHKRIRSSKTYLAHFEGEVGVGQPAVIEESRPISKSKRWLLVEVGGKPVGGQRSEVRVQREVVKRPEGERPKAVQRGKKEGRKK